MIPPAPAIVIMMHSLACALHGDNGQQAILAAVEHDRALDRRIFEMIQATR